MEHLSTENLKFEVYQELGECYTHTGDLEKAFVHFETAKSLDPCSERPYLGQGVAELQKNDIDSAKESFNRAIALNPNSDKALAGLAMALTSAGDNEEALTVYQKALDLDPSNKSALLGLIQSAYGFLRYDVAENYLNRYLALYPGNVKILYCLAGTLYKQNKMPDALEVLERIFMFEPDHPEANSLLDMIARQTSDSGYAKCENS